MSNLDKDIVITPNKDTSADPSIAFSGANATVGPQTIYANVYPLNSGTISFEGSAGQLFSITNTLSGTIFSVNDVSGIPSIEVLDSGVIRLAQYNGNVGIGTSTAQAGFKLQVTGNAAVTGRVGIGTSNVFGVSNALVVYGSIMAYGNIDLANPTGGTSGIYFNDGTYQTTAAGTVQNSSGVAGTVQYSAGSGAFAGDAANFFWNSANSRLGIGTGSPTNTLSVWGATPAYFRTTNGADIYEVVIGNTTSTSTTIGYSSTPSPLAFGYIAATASAVKNITFNSAGRVGIGGTTQPRNTLDVAGSMVIGATYAGNANYTSPANSLGVQGSVGVGTSSALNTLDVRGGIGATSASNFGGGVSVASLTSNGAITGTNYLITTASSTQASGLAVQRVFTKSVSPGELYKLAEFEDVEGTVAIEIQVSSETGAHSGTSTYRFQGGYNSLPASYYRLLPFNNGRGHGDGADNGYNNAWHVYIYGVTVNGSPYRYGVAVFVPAAVTGKGLITTITEIKRGMTFTDKSGDAVITSFTNSGTIFSDLDVLVQNNVGIGTVTPNSALHVQGEMRVVNSATNIGARFSIADASGTPELTLTRTDNTGIFYLNTPSYFAFQKKISVAGDVLVGSSSGVYGNGTASLTIGSGDNSYLNLGVKPGGTFTEVMRLTNGALVGIGTITPGSKLDVLGNSSFRNDISVAGTARVGVLVSNGAISGTTGTFSGNVNISGNLNVTGAINTENANVIVVQDPIIYIGEDNPANLWDMGLVASYNSGTYYHTGLVRNKDDSAWTLFDTLPSEPNLITGHIEWSNASITYATFKAGNVRVVGNARSISSSTGTIVINGVGGLGVGGNINVGGTHNYLAGNVGIGVAASGSRLQVLGSGDPTVNTIGLKVGLDAHLPITSAPQYGIYIDQWGGRYAPQTGLYISTVNPNGLFGGPYYGANIFVRSTSQAYQVAYGVNSVAENDSANYGTQAYAVKGIAISDNNGGGTIVGNGQGAWGGHFISYGRGNAVGVYADAYHLASPIAGATATPLLVASNGTELMRVTASGNVGIGVSTPTSKLSIQGGTPMFAGWNRSLSLNATYPVMVFNSNNTKYSGIGVDYTSTSAGFIFWTNGSSEDISGTGNIAIRINHDTNVSIGDSTPISKLQVATANGAAPTNVSGTGSGAIRLRTTTTAGVGIGPSIIFEGQTNNTTSNYGFAAIQGFKSSAAASDYSGSLAFYTQNAGGATAFNERMRIDANGNVGIGTNAPIALINIFTGASGVAGGLRIQNTGLGNTATDGFEFGIDSSNNGRIWSFDGNNILFGSQNTERARMDVDGRFLFGGTSAYSTAKVQLLNGDDSNGSGSRAQIAFQFNGTGYSHFIASRHNSAANSDGNALVFYLNNSATVGGSTAPGTGNSLAMLMSQQTHIWYTANVERMRIDSTGKVGIGTTIPSTRLDVADGYLHFNDGWGVVWGAASNPPYVSGNNAEDIVTIGAAGTEVMRVTGTGRVGIGSTTPTSALDVNGSITMFNEGQNLDARYLGNNFIRGWYDFAVGGPGDLVYTSNVTAPVGTTVVQMSVPVWARGPRIPLDITRNYEVEFYVRRTVAGASPGNLYMSVQEWDANGANIAGDGTDYSYPVSSLPQSSLTLGQWYNYRFIIGPYGGVKGHDPNGRFIGLGFIANYSAGNDTMQFCGFRIRPLPRYPGDALTIYNSGWVGIGTTTPGSALDVNGNATLRTPVTTTAATHYYVQTGSDNVVRPKTLANVQSEVVTFSAVSAALNAYSVKTSNYTAVNNDRLLCDTSGGTFTITLPATPTLGTNITIYDKANFTAIPLTVARNGSTIEGLADDFSLDIGQTRNEIVYDGTTWHIYVSIGPRGLPGSNAAPSSSVAYSIALG